LSEIFFDANPVGELEILKSDFEEVMGTEDSNLFKIDRTHMEEA